MVKDGIINILSGPIGVEVYVYVEEKIDVEKKEKRITKVKKLNANDKLRKVLTDKLKEKIEKSFLNEVIQFNELNEYEERKESYLIINKQEFTGLDLICKLDNIEEDFLENKGKIIGFIFKLGNESNYVIIYENCYPFNLIKKDSMQIIIEKKDQQYKIYNKDLIKISANIDILIIGDNIITNKVGLLEEKFNFRKYKERKVEEAIENIEKLELMIDGLSKVSEWSKEKEISNKIIKSKNSEVLKLDKKLLIEKIKISNGYKGKFEIKNDKMVINSKQSFKNFLTLLNDGILKSDITDNYYDTSSKKKVADEN